MQQPNLAVRHSGLGSNPMHPTHCCPHHHHHLHAKQSIKHMPQCIQDHDAGVAHDSKYAEVQN